MCTGSLKNGDEVFISLSFLVTFSGEKVWEKHGCVALVRLYMSWDVMYDIVGFDDLQRGSHLVRLVFGEFSVRFLLQDRNTAELRDENCHGER